MCFRISVGYFLTDQQLLKEISDDIHQALLIRTIILQIDVYFSYNLMTSVECASPAPRERSDRAVAGWATVHIVCLQNRGYT